MLSRSSAGAGTPARARTAIEGDQVITAKGVAAETASKEADEPKPLFGRRAGGESETAHSACSRRDASWYARQEDKDYGAGSRASTRVWQTTQAPASDEAVGVEKSSRSRTGTQGCMAVASTTLERSSCT